MSKANILSPQNTTRKTVDSWKSYDDPESVIKEVADRVSRGFDFNNSTTIEFKATTLNEFDNGVLMTEVIPDKYRTMAIDMSRQLQRDYNCQIASEKAIAEMAVINYVRFLDLQERMIEAFAVEKEQSYHHDSCLNNKDPFYASSPYRTACQRTVLELKLLGILGREMDRAHRQYLTAIQMLHNLRQPTMQVNIKTQTAVVGQNQMVQANNYE